MLNVVVADKELGGRMMDSDIEEINKALDNISDNLKSIGNTMDSLINKLETKSDFTDTADEMLQVFKGDTTNIHAKCPKRRCYTKLIIQLSISIIGCIALVTLTKMYLWR